jgi:hypothetical protein
LNRAVPFPSGGISSQLASPTVQRPLRMKAVCGAVFFLWPLAYKSRGG